MSLKFDAEIYEGIPSTQVYMSFNGKIYLGGFPIIRISRAVFTVSQGLKSYFEVGARPPTIYAGDFGVRGSITRAYMNGAEWMLAIGLEKNSFFDPGVIYDEETIGTLINNINSGGFNEFSAEKSYPIKTIGKFEINADSQLRQVDPDNNSLSQGTMQVATVRGLEIDSSTLRVGRGGDLITSGPIDWIGETVHFSVDPLT